MDHGALNRIALSFTVLFFPLSSWAQGDEPSISNGPYMGQNPPGITPEIFAADINDWDDKLHSSLVFSPDGREVYWSKFSVVEGIRQERIWVSRMDERHVWSMPRVAEFSGKYRDGQPFISPDGEKLFFSSLRPVGHGDLDGNANLWYVEKRNNGWGPPRCLDPGINTQDQDWFPTIAANGNIYWCIKQPEKPWNIFVSFFRGGKYVKPEILGETINSQYNEMTPCIHPHEDCLLFFSERPTGSFSEGRIYISYRGKNGGWTPAEKVKIELPGTMVRFPNLSFDGKYLFFTGLVDSSEKPFWVSAELVIEMGFSGQ